MFGIGPYAGRVLTPQDDRKGADPVVVISYRAWQQKYGGDRSVVGSSFSFNGQPFTVVGIAAPGYFGDRLQEPPAFWVPLSLEPLINGPSAILDYPQQDWLDIIGRVAPGADPKKIEAHLQVELQQWLLSPIAQTAAGRARRGLQADVTSGARWRRRTATARRIRIGFAIADVDFRPGSNHRLRECGEPDAGAGHDAQIANIDSRSVGGPALAANSADTYGELRAGAAGRNRGSLPGVHRDQPDIAAGVSRYLRGDSRVPVVAGAGVYFCGLAADRDLFWSCPGVDHGERRAGRCACAARAVRPGAAADGRKNRWSSRKRRCRWFCSPRRDCLTQSLRNMHNQNFGFETPNRYILHIDPQMAGYKPEQIPALYRQLHDSLAAIPGMAQVSFSLYSPMEGDNWGETVYIQGQPPPPPDSNQNSASWVRVSEGYFETLGTKIIQGRSFSDQDSPTAERVAVVNQAFAKKFFKDESAIGHHFGNIDMKYAGNFAIVGVTEDTTYRDPKQKRPTPCFFCRKRRVVAYDDPRFVTFENRSHYLNAVELRTLGKVTGLETQVRHALADVNQNLAVIDFMSFGAQVENNFNQQAMIAKLTSLFGFLALILASIGLYGVTAYSVERRTNEIGIRMALGAGRMSILKLVLRGAAVQMGIALAIGIPVTIAAGHAMASQLFGIKPYDPRILLITAIVLAFAALIAAAVPARRAATLNPIRALRME